MSDNDRPSGAGDVSDTSKAYESAPAVSDDGPMSWPESDGSDSPPPRNGMAITAAVCGGLALIAIFLLGSPIFGIPLGVGGIVTGILAIRQVRKGISNKKGLAITGLVLGIISIVISIVLFVLSYRLYNDCKSELGHEPSTEELKQCAEDR